MPNITTNHATTNTNNKKNMFKKEARCGGRVARESKVTKSTTVKAVREIKRTNFGN